jgi:CheY-like chemotaxis protein
MDYDKPAQVLIIDDDAINNFILEKLIIKIAANAQIKVCLSGEGAIDYLLGLVKRNVSYPDFIFVDVAMPVMDGWAFLDQYIHDGLDKILHSKIFVATSSIFKRDHDKAFTYAIVKDVLIKPFTIEALTKILAPRRKLV